MKLFNSQTEQEGETVLDIAGMTCNSCTAHVRKALMKVKGVHDVQIRNWSDARATVFGNGFSADELLKQASVAGYPATMRSRSASSTREKGEEASGNFDVDLAVIGTGGGGMAAALKAAENGKTVAIFEKGTVGGTCVNIGCVPSKTLIRAAEAAHRAKSNPFLGVDTTFNGLDWDRLRRQKDVLVEGLRQAKYLDVLARYPDNIVLKQGRAQFLDTRTLKLDSGEIVRSRRIVIATGARPKKLALLGASADSFLDSTSLMDLPRFPKSLLVIGGRVIALELGQAFARLGARVTILQRSPGLLPEHEPEVGRAMADYLRQEGMEVITQAVPLELLAETPLKRLKVRVPEGERVFEAEAILMAVGRTPNTDNLGLEAVGVKTDAQGFIEVDEHLQTSVPGIYAAGDVTTHPKLVYLAAKSGNIAATNAFNLPGSGVQTELDIRVLPEVVFTDPQVATVGLTEAQANSMGHEVQATSLPLEHVPRALAARDTRGFVKLVVDRKTDRLLGAHIVGAEAGEVIQTAALAIQMGFTHGFKVSELRDMFFPYLVQAEGLKLAAQTLTKDVKALSCCAG